MTKYKLPRKLKKGLKNLYFCKEYLTNYHRNLILKSRQTGMTSLVYAELRKTELLMLRPYPVTKWVMKAKKLKAKRFLTLSTATIPIQNFSKYMKSFDAWYKDCYGGVVKKQ